MLGPTEERRQEREKRCKDEKVHDVKNMSYSWRQTQEDIEVSFLGDPLAPEEVRSAQVVIRSRHLLVVIRGVTLFDDDLWEAVRTEESTWTVSDGTLVVLMQKVPLEPAERNNWPRCGKSEPHKYEEEHLARLARGEAKRAAREAKQATATASRDSAEASPARRAPVGGEASTLGNARRGLPLDCRMQRAAPAGAPLTGAPPAPAATAPPGRAAAAEQEEEEEEEEPVRLRPPTTSTAAMVERIRREEAGREASRWQKGTAAERWEVQERRPKGLGPATVAEMRRRGAELGPV